MADVATSTLAPKRNRASSLNVKDAYPRDRRLKLGRVKAPKGALPRSYMVKVDGDCLGPVVRHGETVCIEPRLPVKGEIAAFYVKGRENGALKRLTMNFHGFPVHPESEVVPIIQFEQFNPPKRYQQLGSHFDAIHRAGWVMRDGKWVKLDELILEFDKTRTEQSEDQALDVSDLQIDLTPIEPILTSVDKRIALPEPLPDWEHSRALWIGYEASRWLPFDAKMFLERMLAIRAPVSLSGKWTCYAMPEDPAPEHDFLMGWHNAFENSVAMIRLELVRNESLRNQHLAMATAPRRRRGASRAPAKDKKAMS